MMNMRMVEDKDKLKEHMYINDHAALESMSCWLLMS
jgi:hypothetical protein